MASEMRSFVMQDGGRQHLGFQDGSRRHLELQKWSPFLNFLTNHHQS